MISSRPVNSQRKNESLRTIAVWRLPRDRRIDLVQEGPIHRLLERQELVAVLVRVVGAVKLFVSLDRILLCARRQQVLRLWVAEEDDAERSCLEVTDDLFAPICSQRASLCRSRPHLCTHPSDNLALDVFLADVEPRLELDVLVVAFSDLESPLAVHRRAAVDEEERRRLLPLFGVWSRWCPDVSTVPAITQASLYIRSTWSLASASLVATFSCERLNSKRRGREASAADRTCKIKKEVGHSKDMQWCTG